jgi:hypothetical protein
MMGEGNASSVVSGAGEGVIEGKKLQSRSHISRSTERQR